MRSSEPKAEFFDVSTRGGEDGRGDYQWGWHWWAGTQFTNCSILDVGAGLGGSRERLNHTGTNQITLQDAMTLNSVDLTAPISEIPDKSYDVVTAFEVLEHVVEDIDFVNDLIRIARKAVFMTTPNWKHSKAQNPWHVREHTPSQLARFAKGYRWRGFSGGPHGDAKFGTPITEHDTVRFLQHNDETHALLIDVETRRPDPVPNSFSILVPTARPPLLARTLVSIMQQSWLPGDELVIVNDGANPETDRVLKPFIEQFPDRIRVYHTPKNNNDYGHTPRNMVMPLLKGEYCIHMDDDDVYVADAFQVIRRKIEATRKPMYMFRMRFWDTGYTIWAKPAVEYGNVSTQQIIHRLDYGTYGYWQPVAGGDLGFIWSTAELNNNDVCWDDTIVTICRPEYDLIEGVKWTGEKRSWYKSVTD